MLLVLGDVGEERVAIYEWSFERDFIRLCLWSKTYEGPGSKSEKICNYESELETISVNKQKQIFFNKSVLVSNLEFLNKLGNFRRNLDKIPSISSQKL